MKSSIIKNKEKIETTSTKREKNKTLEIIVKRIKKCKKKNKSTN